MNGDCTHERNLAKLRKDLGEVFLAALADPETVELVLNADGTLWQERLGEYLRVIGTMTASSADAVMRGLAAYHHTTITRENPSIECELPLDGSRFAGQIPPIVPSPVFAVRKRASRVFTLEQYVDGGIMTQEADGVPLHCDRRSPLTATSSLPAEQGVGKTTLLNALIRELTDQSPNERLIIIEDTAEIQCAAKNYVQYHTSPERSMTDLVRMAMRMRPDRILVGEVRGPEALDLLTAWNTGHQGGIASLQANSAEAGLTRLLSLVSRNQEAPRDIEPLIGEAVDVIVHIERADKGRAVREILQVFGSDRATQAYRLSGI